MHNPNNFKWIIPNGYKTITASANQIEYTFHFVYLVVKKQKNKRQTIDNYDEIYD